MAWADWWPDGDTIQEQAVHVRHHFSAGLEDRPRPSREERARGRALMEHELTLVQRATVHVRPMWRCRA